MKIQFASDIHLELSDNSRFMKSVPFEVTGDVLVFAGDTGYLRDRSLPNLKFWKWASANYREVLLVPGNHEFYGNGAQGGLSVADGCRCLTKELDMIAC